MYAKRTLMVGGVPFETVLPAVELKEKPFNTLFEMARAQASASTLSEDDVEFEISASRQEK